MADSQPKSERPKPDPKALTPEYHKARKQLMLWAGILFIWELVGIDLEKAKETGGNAGAIITAIKSPQAVPWVLLILVIYFLIKTTIEWYQCNLVRRRLRVSRFDYLLACGVSIAAFTLYCFQRIKGTQVADKIAEYGFVRLGASFGMLFVFAGFARIISAWRKGHRQRSQDFVQAAIACFGTFFLLSNGASRFVGGFLVVVCGAWLTWETIRDSET